MFDYKEAERRLRLGCKIKREAWKNAFLLLVKNYVAVSPEVEDSTPKLYDWHYGAFWDLNDEDLNGTDWVEIQ